MVLKKLILDAMLIIFEIPIFFFLLSMYGLSSLLSYKYILVYAIFLLINGHYQGKSMLIWDEIKSLIKAHFWFWIVAILLSQDSVFSKLSFDLVIILIGMFIYTLVLNRTLRIIFRKFLAKRTLVIGTGDDACRIGQISTGNRFALTQVIGYIDVNDCKELEGFKQESSIIFKNHLDKVGVYPYSKLDEVISCQKVEQVIIAIPEANAHQVDVVMKSLYGKVLQIKYIPDVNNTMTVNSSIQDFDGVLLISMSAGKITFIGRVFKRFVDILAGLVGCLLLIPLTIYVKYKSVKSGDHDSIFFSQDRIGKDGSTIKIYKYRSMVPNAEQVLEELMAQDENIKKEYLTNKKLVNDPRITKIGDKLRKTSLDEFPQFINVLKGDMSLVGPRPYLFREIDDMGIYYESVIACKPGITGMWQANGRSDVCFDERLKLDDYYYKNWSTWLDLIIVYKTIKGVVYGKGAM